VADVGGVFFNIKKLSWEWFRANCGVKLDYDFDCWVVDAKLVVLNWRG